MARTLSEKDVEMLKKLAPECEDVICAGSGANYRSILPPVSNHYATSDEDFEVRLNRLDYDEMKYLSEVIFDGSESLLCVREEHVEILVRLMANKYSKEVAKTIKTVYENAGFCDY